MNKEKIKRIIPQWLLNFYHKIQYPFHVLPLVEYDARRFIKHSAKSDSEESLIGLITNNMHSIEKGFTMPDFRYGFGQTRLKEVLDQCIEYMEKYYDQLNDQNNTLIIAAAKTIYDYKTIHLDNHFELPADIVDKIDTFLHFFPGLTTNTRQIEITKDKFFKHCSDDFLSFSNSRRSSRIFTNQPVDIQTLKSAICLAQNAPSACNRQSTRVYLVESKSIIESVFKQQGGNRGFGHTVDKLIVVCGYLGNYHDTERNCVYVDGGIFTMNLVYSLHYYGIGACILNWSAKKKRDKTLRQILPIRDCEVVIDLIACGNVPEVFRLCRSEKKELDQILTEIV